MSNSPAEPVAINMNNSLAEPVAINMSNSLAEPVARRQDRTYEDVQVLVADMDNLQQQNTELVTSNAQKDKLIRLLWWAPKVNLLAGVEAIFALTLVVFANCYNVEPCAQIFDQLVWWICALVNTILSIAAFTWVLIKHFSTRRGETFMEIFHLCEWGFLLLFTVGSACTCFYFIQKFSRIAATSDVDTRWVVLCDLSVDWLIAVVGFHITAFLDDTLVKQRVHPGPIID